MVDKTVLDQVLSDAASRPVVLRAWKRFLGRGWRKAVCNALYADYNKLDHHYFDLVVRKSQQVYYVCSCDYQPYECDGLEEAVNCFILRLEE